MDLDGILHDYGFTFLNNEAVYLRLRHARAGQVDPRLDERPRTVEGDTATGDDIYHWRFGPRSTTRRNLDYYFWGWTNPESVPWGYQVQDGGAVLGFSYHDLMARLKTAGPDDAWQRLQRDPRLVRGSRRRPADIASITSDPARGTMQGGNVAGGLGLDKEFFESILVPQVMLYGFLGLHPTADGCTIDPRLPSDGRSCPSRGSICTTMCWTSASPPTKLKLPITMPQPNRWLSRICRHESCGFSAGDGRGS